MTERTNIEQHRKLEQHTLPAIPDPSPSCIYIDQNLYLHSNEIRNREQDSSSKKEQLTRSTGTPNFSNGQYETGTRYHLQ